MHIYEYIIKLKNFFSSLIWYQDCEYRFKIKGVILKCAFFLLTESIWQSVQNCTNFHGETKLSQQLDVVQYRCLCVQKELFLGFLNFTTIEEIGQKLIEKFMVWTFFARKSITAKNWIKTDIFLTVRNTYINVYTKLKNFLCSLIWYQICSNRPKIKGVISKSVCFFIGLRHYSCINQVYWASVEG